MGRTALLACPEGGTNLSAMAGLDRSSFNTEPGLRSISFSIFQSLLPAHFCVGFFIFCLARFLRRERAMLFCFCHCSFTSRLGLFVVYYVHCRKLQSTKKDRM